MREYPAPIAGWRRIQSEERRYPRYERDGGWIIEVRHMNDVQIACSHDSDLYFQDARIWLVNFGWGDRGIVDRMNWVNARFAVQKPAQQLDDRYAWKDQTLDFLRKLEGKREIPDEIRKEAQILAIMGRSR